MSEPARARLPGASVAAVGALFFVSGAAGLVYEVLWFRLLLLKLGGTGLSVATVTAAFMAGLGIGAWLFGTRLALRSRPLAVYGVLEIVIGLYALAVPALIGFAGRLDATLFGAEPGAFGRLSGFFIAGAVLLPPTLCMGATLPVLSRLVGRTASRPGRFVGILYGLNTIGAVLGAGTTGFLFMPRVGLGATLIGAACANLLLGALALALTRFGGALAQAESAAQAVPEGETAPVSPSAASATGRGVAAIAAFGSGLVTFILQVSWTRILTLIFGSSVYAFSLILVVFLTGLGAGAVAGARLCDRIADARRGLAWCLALAGATALLGQGLYAVVPRMYLDAIAASGERQALGGAMWMAAAIMLPTTLLLGAAFPFVIRLATGDQSGRAAAGVGRVYAANTSGGVIGAYAGALWLVPAFGLASAVSVAATILLALGAALSIPVAFGYAASGERAGAGRRSAATLPIVAAATFFVWLVAIPGWDRGVMSMGVGLWGARSRAQGRDLASEFESLSRDRVLFYRDGITSTVAVKEVVGPARAERYMTVDGKIDASNAGDMPTQILGGQIPVLVAGKRGMDVLVVGYASGVSVGSVLTHPVSSVTVVEIEGVVEDASHHFDDVNNRPLSDPRTRFVTNDARAYLERTDRRFDVIISEPSSSWLSGPSKLFTREAFEAIRSRLKPGGLAGQWLQTYDIGSEDAITVIRTLREVFREVAVFRTLGAADLLLLASDEPVRIDLAALDAAWAGERVRADLLRAGVRGPCDLLDRLIAEPAAVDAVVGAGPLNTDDNALLEYHGAQQVGARGDAEFVARFSAHARGAAAMIDADREAAGQVLVRWAERCQSDGAPGAARSFATARLALGIDPVALWVLGETERSAGDRLGALERFAKALELAPRHPAARIATAMTLQELDRPAAARDAWTRAEEVAPADPTVPEFRGLARLHLRDWTGAVADFRRARTLSAGGQGALRLDLYEGIALEESGDLRSARLLLERAVSAYPENQAPGTDGIAAIERLARALAADPTTARRALTLSHRAERERAKVTLAILDESARLLVDLNDTAARGFLRSMIVLDPALHTALERELETVPPSPTRERLRTALQAAAHAPGAPS